MQINLLKTCAGNKNEVYIFKNFSNCAQKFKSSPYVTIYIKHSWPCLQNLDKISAIKPKTELQFDFDQVSDVAVMSNMQVIHVRYHAQQAFHAYYNASSTMPATSTLVHLLFSKLLRMCFTKRLHKSSCSASVALVSLHQPVIWP